MAFFDIQREHFVGFALHAINRLENDLRTPHRQFVTFTAHGFKQDGEMQFAPSGNEERVGLRRILDTQRHIGQQLALQTLADLATGDKLAFRPGIGRAIDHEGHVQRRLVDLEHRQGFGGIRVGDRAADGKFVNASQQHDVASDGFFHRHPFDTAKAEDMIHLGTLRSTVLEIPVGIGLPVHHGDLLRRLQPPTLNAANTDATDVRGVIKRGNLQLQRPLDMRRIRRRDVLQDRVEHRAHVGAGLLEVGRRVTIQGRGIDHRKIKLFVRCAEFVEEVEGMINHPVRARAITVDLVHHDDRFQAQCQRLLGHEARLRHRPFNGIDQQQHTIDHAQHPLDLAAEIRVAGRIDDVDMHALIINRQILRQDGDSTFLFQIVRIHHPFDDVLVGGKSACLLEEFVDQRGLAVVNVGDDGDIANRTRHEHNSLKRAKILAWPTG